MAPTTEKEENILGQEGPTGDELPPMEDRTLFLGCLTQIVASSYDFDLTIEGNENGKDSKNNKSGSSSTRSTRELREEASLYFDDDDEEEEETTDSAADKTEPKKLSDEEKKLQKAKIKEKMALAEQRHLVRRYKVAQEFVLNAAKLLFLDEPSTETVQQDFLPQLNVLLEPSGKNNNNHTGSTTKIKQTLANPEETAKEHAKQLHSSSSLGSLDWVKDNDSLQGYLQKLNNQSAYQCLMCLLFQHLLHAGDTGYDARVRFWFKTLTVTLWIQHMEQSSSDNSDSSQSRLAKATNKFEALESCCADRLLTLAANTANAQQAAAPKQKSLAGNIWKGVQIGGVGLGAGVLLAVTGGMAAPGIAAGLAALGLGAAAGTFLTLASSAAVVSLFGVAGGSLAAYKMNRRVSGLTEFIIHQELVPSEDGKKKEKEATPPKAQLFQTIGLSGWVLDKSDFQRPWGVVPTDPPIADSVELLQRFYHVHNPELVEYAEDIWKKQNQDRDKLWKLLKNKYGCDPDHLWAKDKDALAADYESGLTKEEIQLLDQTIVAIGSEEGGEKDSKDKSKQGSSSSSTDKTAKTEGTSKETAKQKDGKEKKQTSLLGGWGKSKGDAKKDDSNGADFEDVAKHTDAFKPPDHLKTVWDYPTRYGGELYTVQWESDLLAELSDSIRQLAMDLAKSAGQQVAKTTILSTLVIAAALPMTVAGLMSSIDGTWKLVMDRADQAGKELARSLLVNQGGHRPVTLVGYSFGARIILKCLKELAQYQQKWEEYQIEKKANEANKALADDSSDKGKKKKDKKEDKKDMCKVGDLEFDREPASVVEDAILMGMPKYLDLRVWKACREVVAGRLVNVYSRQDKVLAYVFKYKNILGSYQPVVGNGTVAVPGVENIDVTDMVASHQDYSTMVGPILQRVRHGQPVRSTSHALDEVALMAEAEALAKEAEEGEGDGK